MQNCLVISDNVEMNTFWNVIQRNNGAIHPATFLAYLLTFYQVKVPERSSAKQKKTSKVSLSLLSDQRLLTLAKKASAAINENTHIRGRRFLRVY